MKTLFPQAGISSLILNTLDALIVILDHKGRVVGFNRAAEELSGYTFEEISGKNYFDLFLLPEEVGAIQGLIAELNRGKFPNRHQNHWKARDGRLYWIEWNNSALIDGNGQVEYIIGTGIDATDRKKAETELQLVYRELDQRVRLRTAELEESILSLAAANERLIRTEVELNRSQQLYKNLAEAAHDMIFVISRDGYIEYVNSFAARAFGTVPLGLIGRIWTELFGGDLGSRQAKNLGLVFQTREAHYFEELSIFPGGKEIWLDSWLVPLLDDNDEVSAVLGLSRDATEKHKAEIELQNALQKERELNELQSNFVAMTTHQFRTPLSQVLSSAELLEYYGDQWTPEKRKNHLRRIQTAARFMGQMISEVLELKRTEAIRTGIVATTIDLGAFCRDLIEDLSLADAGMHSISLVLVEPLGSIRQEESMLRHVLDNLLSNAVKYSPAGMQVNLEVSEEDSEVIFRVRDQGIGIPEKDLQKIFTPFSRGSNVNHIPGTGLGLAIVQQMVEQMGGRIEVVSREGKGSEFLLRLPKEFNLQE